MRCDESELTRSQLISEPTVVEPNLQPFRRAHLSNELQLSAAEVLSYCVSLNSKATGLAGLLKGQDGARRTLCSVAALCGRDHYKQAQTQVTAKRPDASRPQLAALYVPFL